MYCISLSSAVYQGPAEGGPCMVEMVERPRQPLSRSLPGGKNLVSVLMEYSQHNGNPIEFIITGQVGPPHDPRYCILQPPLNLSLWMLFSPTPHSWSPLWSYIFSSGKELISYFCSMSADKEHNTVCVPLLFTTLCF